MLVVLDLCNVLNWVLFISAFIIIGATLQNMSVPSRARAFYVLSKRTSTKEHTTTKLAADFFRRYWLHIHA